MLPIGILVVDRVKEIINDVDFESLDADLIKIKEDCRKKEDILLQRIWLTHKTGMEYSEFYQINAVNK